MSAPIFKFSISDLNQIYGNRARDRDKETGILERKYREWKLARTEAVELDTDTLAAIITDPDATEALVQWAEKLGYILKAVQLSTSQIRNIFGTVRQIEMTWTPNTTQEVQKASERKLLLLKPRLAYVAHKQKPVAWLAGVLSAAIDEVQSSHDNFQRFVSFFEAILAYHTAAGGQ